LEKSTKTANDTLINHQQQSSLQEEANKTNSRDIDTDFQDRTTKGRCILYMLVTIRHAARVQMKQDISQGWEQVGTSANNRLHILNMRNCLNKRWWRVHLYIPCWVVLKLWHKLMVWACGHLNLDGAQKSS